MSAKLLMDNVEFGVNAKVRLYVLRMFRFGELIYPYFHIIAYKMELPCQMILSVTMFQRIQNEVDDENQVFNLTVPDGQSNVRNLVIKDGAENYMFSVLRNEMKG